MVESGIWVALAATLAVSATMLPSFRDPENMANILRQAGVLGLLAMGQTFVICAGMIDLSVGMLTGLVVVLSCAMIAGDAALTLPVAGAMVLLGASVGLLNGLLVTRLKIHPLILTFGMMSVLQGVIFIFTNRSVGRAGDWLTSLANGEILGLPIVLLLLLPVAAIAHVLLRYSPFGYHLLAVGGNAHSARRAGIAVRRVIITAFVLSGISAALAGLLLAGRLGTGYPLAGAGLELDAIVAVVLGGTALAGGRGSVLKSLGGVLFLAVVANLLNLIQISAYAQMFIKGLIVIIAILLNQPRRAPA